MQRIKKTLKDIKGDGSSTANDPNRDNVSKDKQLQHGNEGLAAGSTGDRDQSDSAVGGMYQSDQTAEWKMAKLPEGASDITDRKLKPIKDLRKSTSYDDIKLQSRDDRPLARGEDYDSRNLHDVSTRDRRAMRDDEDDEDYYPEDVYDSNMNDVGTRDKKDYKAKNFDESEPIKIRDNSTRAKRGDAMRED